MKHCEECGEELALFDEIDAPETLDEIADLIAEAARTSRHAAKAYSLLREAFTQLPTIEARQTLISGRMRDAA